MHAMISGMMTGHRYVCVSALLIVGMINVAAAQLVDGGFMRSYQEPVTPLASPHSALAGAGGSANGVLIGVSTPTSARSDFRIEMGIPAFVPHERAGVRERARGTHRDVIVSGLAVLSPLPFVSVMAGGSLVVQQVTREVVTCQAGSCQPFLENPLDTNRFLVGAVLGAELPLPASTRLSIVPGVRVHLIRRSADDGDLGDVVFRPSVLVRVRLR